MKDENSKMFPIFWEGGWQVYALVEIRSALKNIRAWKCLKQVSHACLEKIVLLLIIKAINHWSEIGLNDLTRLPT
jgi:hypothetical protein